MSVGRKNFLLFWYIHRKKAGLGQFHSSVSQINNFVYSYVIYPFPTNSMLLLICICAYI